MTRTEFIATTTARYLAVLKMESVNVSDIDAAVLQANATARAIEKAGVAPWLVEKNETLKRIGERAHSIAGCLVKAKVEKDWKAIDGLAEDLYQLQIDVTPK